MTDAFDRRNLVADIGRSDLRTDELDYDLPAGLIAQEPLLERDAARLLVVDRVSDRRTHSSVRELGSFLRPGDLLVANNSRVLPARLRAIRTDSGGQVELLLLRQEFAGRWRALARPARRIRPGVALTVLGREPDLAVEIEVVDSLGDGQVVVVIPDAVTANLNQWGEVPLPPYVRKAISDPERYQTVYARPDGSAAAPTAGLHFTPSLIGRLQAGGIGWAEVTLHVGLDTFRPVTTERLADHRIHHEWCEVDGETAVRIAATRAAGGRIVAVGTTAARTLETLGRTWDDNDPRGFVGMTDLFILPGYRWRLVDGLLTNFHLPRTTLLAMVSALAGWNLVRGAYQEAVAARYRFFSFGDAMLIL